MFPGDFPEVTHLNATEECIYVEQNGDRYRGNPPG
jgi:hypothetical protein